MMPPTGPQRRAWMMQWRSAAIELARVRQAESQRADLAQVASDLDDACTESAHVHGATETSGLIEQQRLLHHGRRA